MIFSLRTQQELELEIEERKKAEEEKRLLLISKEATTQLMNKKDEFLSIASHELKTPIATLKTSLQLLQRMVSTKPELENTKALVDKATKQTHKLTSLINDLLDVTKIQAGKVELKKQSFNLLELLEESVDECDFEGNKHHINISCDPNITVFADRLRIDQVLCNLITNAIKYSPNNYDLSIVAETTLDKKVKVLVIDKGIGIPENQIKDVFDRFFRVESTSQNFSGIGLGLFISSEIIKRHGGEIGVESKEGKGSVFWLTLP